MHLPSLTCLAGTTGGRRNGGLWLVARNLIFFSDLQSPENLRPEQLSTILPPLHPDSQPKVPAWLVLGSWVFPALLFFQEITV